MRMRNSFLARFCSVAGRRQLPTATRANGRCRARLALSATHVREATVECVHAFQECVCVLLLAPGVQFVLIIGPYKLQSWTSLSCRRTSLTLLAGLGSNYLLLIPA